LAQTCRVAKLFVSNYENAVLVTNWVTPTGLQGIIFIEVNKLWRFLLNVLVVPWPPREGGWGVMEYYSHKNKGQARASGNFYCLIE